MRRGVSLLLLLCLCACGTVQRTPAAWAIPTRTGVVAAPAMASSASAAAARTAVSSPALASRAVATPTTVPAPAMVVEGVGSGLSTPLTLPAGMLRVRFTHQGQGIFSAELHGVGDSATYGAVERAEGTGARTVAGLFSVNLGGTYGFYVTADGPWRIEVFPLADDDVLAQGKAHPIPQTFTGQGSGLTPFLSAEGRGIAVAVTYRGAGEIHVMLTSPGMSTGIYNGPGRQTPEFALYPLPGGCLCTFVVDADPDGVWTIEVRQP